MTLPELCECNEKQENAMPSSTLTPHPDSSATVNDNNSGDKLSRALKTVLQQAAQQGRATCSLTACVELLSTRPDDVMLCVMPLLPQADAAATIQSTLIRAVCQEHSIRILTVDCDVKLAKAVCVTPEEEEEEEKKMVAEAMVDDNCNSLLKTPATCSDDAPLLISACDNLAPVMGFPCVLVQYPTEGASAEEEEVAEFCKELLFGHSQQEPYLELPD